MTQKSTPSAAVSSLAGELAALDPSLRGRLDDAGFDAARLLGLAASLGEGDAATRRDTRNRVHGDVRGPTPAEVPNAPDASTKEGARLAALGDEAIRRGELAFCVLAGGMATRMGGVVKALVEALEGRDFLELRLADNAAWSARIGKPMPLWLMTSDATDDALAAALKQRKAPAHVATFMQDLGLRLTAEGRLFREADGAPSPYATGHGDLVDAVRRSGLLRRFREAGGKYVWIANLDNLGATVDPAILGHFIETKRDVMVEVCEKAPGDRGGIPAWATTTKDGVERLQVLEEFRLPKTFDAASVRVFNTNTFLVRAEALETARIDWTFFEVEKKVEDRTAVQFERLLQELTAAMPAAYVTVPREGVGSRFLPVKDFEELAKRRPDIETVAKARGMLR
jgi:UTP--glucose-1-phosphate uridylyltransferase